MVQLEKDSVKDFVLGGNALVTLESGKTGCHLTYKIQKSNNDDNLYFIKSLRGSDNEKDYQYIGCYFADTETFVVEKSYKNVESYSWPKSIRTAKYFLSRLNDIPDSLIVYHNGKCCRCGRTLTTPESIKKGIGPECEITRRTLIKRNGAQNIPKKPIKTENEFICPCCKALIGYRFLEMNDKNHRIMENFCDCGQEIDWSDFGALK